MKILNRFVPSEGHHKFLKQLKAVKVGGFITIPSLIPALASQSELMCTAINESLYSFGLYAHGIFIGEVEILHDNDVIAITLEE